VKASVAQSTIWVVIAGMAVVNFAVRFIPIAVVSRVELPRPIARWLSYVPIAVMGALVASSVFTPDGRLANPLTSASLYAVAITALVYRLSRSFLGATIAGMGSFVLLTHFVPFFAH
jgi:branched-subunit amino acid transport protein